MGIMSGRDPLWDAAFASMCYRAVAVFLADRVRVTTSKFGYGRPEPDRRDNDDRNELYSDLLESVDLAVTGFDKLSRRMSAHAG